MILGIIESIAARHTREERRAFKESRRADILAKRKLGRIRKDLNIPGAPRPSDTKLTPHEQLDIARSFMVSEIFKFGGYRPAGGSLSYNHSRLIPNAYHHP